MKILVDCDNVLNNLAESVLEIYNEEWDDNLTIEDIKDYYIENFVKDAAKHDFYHYFTNKKVWKNIKVAEGAAQVINKLREEGHRVYLCTKTEPENAYKKSQWAWRNFGFDPRKDFILCPDKSMIQADAIIDDCEENLTGNRINVCMAYPWNEKFFHKPRIQNYRVHSWEEVYKAISGQYF